MNEKQESYTWKQIAMFIAIVGIIPVMFMINDSRYAMKAEADELRLAITSTQTAQKDNAHKLDFLVKAEAAKTIIAIKQEIQLHKASDDGSMLWHRELANLEARLQRAENYKDCITGQLTNCDAERIW